MSAFKIKSLALRVHNMDAMVAFYSQAFNIQFRPVDTFGLPSQFGEIDGITLKFVPIRDEVDFENYPIHQPGFKVADLQKVIDLAIKHGGKYGRRDQSEGWPTNCRRTRPGRKYPGTV